MFTNTNTDTFVFDIIVGGVVTVPSEVTLRQSCQVHICVQTGGDTTHLWLFPFCVHRVSFSSSFYFCVCSFFFSLMVMCVTSCGHHVYAEQHVHIMLVGSQTNTQKNIKKSKLRIEQHAHIICTTCRHHLHNMPTSFHFFVGTYPSNVTPPSKQHAHIMHTSCTHHVRHPHNNRHAHIMHTSFASPEATAGAFAWTFTWTETSGHTLSSTWGVRGSDGVRVFTTTVFGAFTTGGLQRRHLHTHSPLPPDTFCHCSYVNRCRHEMSCTRTQGLECTTCLPTLRNCVYSSRFWKRILPTSSVTCFRLAGIIHVGARFWGRPIACCPRGNFGIFNFVLEDNCGLYPTGVFITAAGGVIIVLETFVLGTGCSHAGTHSVISDISLGIKIYIICKRSARMAIGIPFKAQSSCTTSTRGGQLPVFFQVHKCCNMLFMDLQLILFQSSCDTYRSLPTLRNLT